MANPSEPVHSLSTEELVKRPQQTDMNVEAGRLALEEGIEFELGSLRRLIKSHQKDLDGADVLYEKATTGAKVKIMACKCSIHKALLECILRMTALTEKYREEKKDSSKPRAISAAPGQQVGVAVNVHLNQPSGAPEAKAAVTTLITERT